MTARLRVIETGPSSSLQDLGRAGLVGIGISPGGAVDVDALLRGHALLGNPLDAAALEVAGYGGKLRVEGTTRIALTGAAMRATLNGMPLLPETTHRIADGDEIWLGPATKNVYAYFHVAGGFLAEKVLGGRGYHGIANLGQLALEGDILVIGDDPVPDAPPTNLLPSVETNRPIRVMQGPQTQLFSEDMRARFKATRFTRSAKGNRQGIRLDHDGPPFATEGQYSLASDFIVAGDLQMTGDGTPFVLLPDCQTMGGYPRIGTVLPSDLARIAQTQPGAELTFQFVSLEEAEQSWRSPEERLEAFRKSVTAFIRDPHEMHDLLGYEFISRPIDE